LLPATKENAQVVDFILFYRSVQFFGLFPSLFAFLLLMADLVAGRAFSSPPFQVAGGEEE